MPPDIPSQTNFVSSTVSNTITDLESVIKSRQPNRLTTTETVTYERENGESFQVATKCWRAIEQDTQPYQREIKITEEWKPIDLGWATEWDKIGTIVIQHLGEKLFQKIPTPEERLENASRSLYVALGSDSISYLEYFPKDSFRAIVSDPRALRIRSKSGVVRAMLTILPG